jgi:hypothetical protein
VFVEGVDLRRRRSLAAAGDRLGQLLDASLVRPERKTRAPCAASSMATVLPTSPPAPKMIAVLCSRRRGLVAAVIDDMLALLLRSLASDAADIG